MRKFTINICGDGAPSTGMSVLVSFLNVGERIPSRGKQFLLFEADVEENLEIVPKFLRNLVHN